MNCVVLLRWSEHLSCYYFWAPTFGYHSVLEQAQILFFNCFIDFSNFQTGFPFSTILELAQNTQHYQSCLLYQLLYVNFCVVTFIITDYVLIIFQEGDGDQKVESINSLSPSSSFTKRTTSLSSDEDMLDTTTHGITQVIVQKFRIISVDTQKQFS